MSTQWARDAWSLVWKGASDDDRLSNALPPESADVKLYVLLPTTHNESIYVLARRLVKKRPESTLKLFLFNWILWGPVRRYLGQVPALICRGNRVRVSPTSEIILERVFLRRGAFGVVWKHHDRAGGKATESKSF